MAPNYISRISGVFPLTHGLHSQWRVDKINVGIYKNHWLLGQAAAKMAVSQIKWFTGFAGESVLNMAVAPSQFPLWHALIKTKNVPWDRVVITHMDNFPVPSNSPLNFATSLKTRFVDHLNPQPKKVFYIRGNKNLANEVKRYRRVLLENPIDIALIGIGVNGHLGFNDPYFEDQTDPQLRPYRADFDDPVDFKVVKLDWLCKAQQESDYPGEKIPEKAMTITIPAIMRALVIFCCVPYKEKVVAVKEALLGNIGEHCPASILRDHDNAYMFLDINSASLFLKEV